MSDTFGNIDMKNRLTPWFSGSRDTAGKFVGLAAGRVKCL
jgi:hypothetical protein